MSQSNLNVGIFLPSNDLGGPQKLTALCANDLARNGHLVHIFIPRLPFFYYFVTLRHRPIHWLRNYAWYHVVNYMRDRSFVFEELLRNDSASGKVSIHNVWRRPTRRQLAGLDYLLVMTIAQVFELQSIFPQEKLIYYLLHPEEHPHRHVEKFRNARSNFNGKFVALSPWTARQVADHIPEPPVVPSAISPLFWENRFRSEAVIRNKDILFYFSSGYNKGGNKGVEIIKAVSTFRPDTKITVWSRDSVPDLPTTVIETHVSEKRLRDLFLSHKMLLFPSTLEGFGMPPVEGMACGCIPILYPGVGGADLYARDGENAIFIQEDDQLFAKRIVELLDDSERLVNMRRAMFTALEPFDPEGYGMRLLKAAGLNV